MKQILTRLDKIIIFCKNVQKTTSLYSQALGLKVYVQSDTFVELRDSNNFSICLQQNREPSQLIKGYSPMLSFRVVDFQKTVQKLGKYEILFDGETKQSQFGKILTFMGMDNELITINNFQNLQQQSIIQESSNLQNQEGDKQTAEIKRLLQKIKI